MTLDNKSNLYGDLRLAAKTILLAVDDAPSAIAGPLASAVNGVIAGMEALTQAEAEAARILSDTKYSTAYRVDSANATVEAAVSAADGAVSALESAAAKARTALEASFLPKAPSGTTEDVWIDRKQDLTNLVQGFQGTPMDKLASLSNLLANAIQSGDQLTAYVLRNKMQFVYLAIGLQNDDVARAFATAMGAQVNADGSAKFGASLLALLQSGGAGTVSGVVVVAKNLISRQAEAFRSNMTRLAERAGLPGAPSR
jgi:hypothetical protein